MALNSAKLKAYQSQTQDERDRVILEHLPQIKYIAQRIAVRLPAGVQLDDLIGAGVIGLLDAYEKFDEGRGVQFKTYAEVRIRGAIMDSLRGLDWAPRSLRAKGREVEQTYARLEQKLGRAASDQEVAEELNLDINELHSLLDQLNSLNIGHFEKSDSEDGRDEDQIPMTYSVTSTEESPFEAVETKEMRAILARAVDQLPERERQIVSLYYHEELTMKEIGHVLGVTESRISQLHTRAMLRMRGKMQSMLNLKKDETRP